MTQAPKWRTNGVRVVRGGALDAAMRGPGQGRATAFDFSGNGGQATWIGTVSLAPAGKISAHHHGRHEVALYVVKGRSRISWGERLEFAADVGPGDFIYFAPYVPHQELNVSADETVEFVVVRSDNERIAISLDVEPVPQPELVF